MKFTPRFPPPIPSDYAMTFAEQCKTYIHYMKIEPQWKFNEKKGTAKIKYKKNKITIDRRAYKNTEGKTAICVASNNPEGLMGQTSSGEFKDEKSIKNYALLFIAQQFALGTWKTTTIRDRLRCAYSHRKRKSEYYLRKINGAIERLKEKK